MLGLASLSLDSFEIYIYIPEPSGWKYFPTFLPVYTLGGSFKKAFKSPSFKISTPIGPLFPGLLAYQITLHLVSFNLMHTDGNIPLA